MKHTASRLSSLADGQRPQRMSFLFCYQYKEEEQTIQAPILTGVIHSIYGVKS